MNSTENDLAESMLRLYGLDKARSAARRYALACMTQGDAAGQAKWSATAARIGNIVDLLVRFRTPDGTPVSTAHNLPCAHADD